MKPASLFAVGACGGALVAFLFLALDSSQSLLPSAGPSTGPALPDNVSPPAARESTALPASDSPEAALAAARELPAYSRLALVSAAASEWAFIDPAGFFAYAEAADSIDDLIAGLEVLIATDPERVFAIAARYYGPANPQIEALYLHAIRGMAGRDPVGTIARLQPLATGAQRDPILASIAEAYAAIDANAALSWAMSVVPPSTDALG
jgi:hypothetical protein